MNLRQSGMMYSAIILLAVSGRAEFVKIINLDNRVDGTYTAAMMKADWVPPSWASWNNGVSEGRAKIVSGAQFSGKSLEVTFPQGKVGPGTGGVQFSGSVLSSDEMYAEYRLMFKDGFNFVKGGKLPGLCGGDCSSGGEKPTGTDGWSARYMFRASGKAVLYLYHMDQPTAYGEDLYLRPGGSQLYFQPGKWYKLTQRIKLNTPGQRDGIVQVWVDGKIALDLKDIRFRTTLNLKVDIFYFSTFFGGSSPDWAPVKTEYAYFDDFRFQQNSPVSVRQNPREAGAIPRLPSGSAAYFNLRGILVRNEPARRNSQCRLLLRGDRRGNTQPSMRLDKSR